MVSLNDSILSAPRIMAQGFHDTLSGSPVIDERDTYAYYNSAVIAGIDPLYVRAMFEKESNAGLNGIAVNTHSWGNMRNPPVGDVPYHIYSDPQKGKYLSFADWLDGCEATINHLRYYTDVLGITKIGDIPYTWAPEGDGGNSPAAYAQFTVDYMNAHADVQRTVKVPRIIVSAGHENIGNITGDMIGQQSADSLRHATGANGEVEYNVAWADALVPLLQQAGYEVVRTDAIYHAEVYQPGADLVIVGHYDGNGSSGHPQYCMASTVHSGPSTDAVDATADTFIDKWYATYPSVTGIPGTGTITVDMTQYYQGWYRTAQTPMAIIEHCLGADASGKRTDIPSPQQAAQADFQAIKVWKPIGVNPQVFVPHDSPDNTPIHPMFWPRWNYLDSLGLALPQMGFPKPDTRTLADGRTAQRFERGWAAGTNPANVVMLFPDEYPQ